MDLLNNTTDCMPKDQLTPTAISLETKMPAVETATVEPVAVDTVDALSAAAKLAVMRTPAETPMKLY